MNIKKSYYTKSLQINLTTNCPPIAKLIDNYLDFSHAKIKNRPAITIGLHIREDSGVDPNEYENFLHYGYAKKGPRLLSSLALKFAKVEIEPKKNLIKAQVLRFHEDFKERILDYVLLRPVRALLVTKGLFFLHSSAVKKDSRTVLICGRSNSGKSTLALTLSRGGFKILADDDCFLRQKGGRLFIYPFPTKMGLRHMRPSSDIAETTGFLHGRKLRYSVRRLYERGADGEIKDAAIVFPIYSKGKKLEITRLKNKDALGRIIEENLPALKSKGNVKRSSVSNFWLLYALTKTASCFELKYNDGLLNQIPTAVEKLFIAGGVDEI